MLGSRRRVNCSRFGDDDAAHAAEFIAAAVVVAANAADDHVRIAGEFVRAIMRGIFGVGFGGQTLRRFQSRGNGVLTGLGTPHLGLQAPQKLFHFGVVSRIGGRAGGLGSLLLFALIYIFILVHESHHPMAAVILTGCSKLILEGELISGAEARLM